MMSMSIADRNEFVCQNLGLVPVIAKECHIPGVDFEDLCQDGYEKFLMIADQYDPSKGSVATFLWPHIKQWLYSQNIKSENLKRISRKIQNAEDDLISQLNRNPTAGEIADYIGFSQKKLDRYQCEIKNNSSTSLDAQLGGEGENAVCLYDFLASSMMSPEEEFFRKENVRLIQEAWSDLTEEEQEVLSCRTTYNTNLESPMSLREFGTRKGYSRMTASNREKSAFTTLKANLKSKGFCA